MGYVGSDLHHPTLAPFAQSIVDDELTRLADAFHAADERVRSLEAQRADAQQEVSAIDAALVDLDGAAMDKALTRRGRLASQIAGVTNALPLAERLRVEANLAWLSRLRTLALAEAQARQDELEPIVAQARDDRRALARAEGAKVARQITEDDYRERKAEVFARGRELTAQAQPLLSRRDEALMVARVCQLRATRFGRDVKLEHPHTWQARATVRQAA